MKYDGIVCTIVILLFIAGLYFKHAGLWILALMVSGYLLTNWK